MKHPTENSHVGLSEMAVHVENLTKKFGDFTAVDDISLHVKRGEIFGFLGANGAGKTTAIRMLCGLITPTSGLAWVDGLSVSTEGAKIKNRIGYMSQKFSLYLDLTIDENISLFGGIYGLSFADVRERGDELIARLGLQKYRSELTAKVPLGFKQRLALGCAVLHRPPVIFLDEPTGGVDPVARRDFWDLIYQLADSGSTVFVTTHYMDEAEYCGRVSIMERGRIIALGSPRELKAASGESTMQDVFIHLVSASQQDAA